MKLKLLFFLIILSSHALSQGSSRGAVSLKLPTTPFVGATGESFVADPTALHSILINPANIASREMYGILFSHTEWIQDIRTEFLSIAAPFYLGTLSLSIGNTSVDDIQLRDKPGPALATFNSQSTFFQLTYGIKLSESMCIGIAPKYLYEKIFVNETTGFGLDGGILYTSPVDGLILGCSLTNLGSLAAFRNERVDLPSQIRFGGTYSFSLSEVTFRTATAISSELGMSINHISIGGEALYNNVIALRLSYQTGYEARGFSAGLGIRYSIIIIDYAYVPFSLQLGNAHIISMGLTF